VNLRFCRHCYKSLPDVWQRPCRQLVCNPCATRCRRRMKQTTGAGRCEAIDACQVKDHRKETKRA
jgi:hypothetical protein